LEKYLEAKNYLAIQHITCFQSDILFFSNHQSNKFTYSDILFIARLYFFYSIN